MVRGQKNYKNAKIYKLVGDDGYFYIGSTCRSLYLRLAGHKSLAKRKPNQKVYRHFNQIGWDHVRIILITDGVPIDNIEQLRRLENDYIEAERQNLHCLNHNRAFRTHENTLEDEAKRRKDPKRAQYMKTFLHDYQKKDKCKEWKSSKWLCEKCNVEITKANISEHRKSKKHIANTI